MVTNRYCDISMSELTSTPTELERGDLIIATVQAKNDIDWSDESSISSPSADVRVKPL